MKELIDFFNEKGIKNKQRTEISITTVFSAC